MNAAAPPWEEAKAAPGGEARRPGRESDVPPFAHDARDTAAAVSVNADGSNIDEMLEVMARQVNEVVTWTKAEGFNEAYRSASNNARGLFQAAVFSLASRARLRKG